MLKMQLSWVTGVSNYFMQLEKLVYAAIGILILAVVSLQQPLPFIVKVVLFIAYSIALFRIQLIAGFFFKRQPVEATSEDQELLKAIEASEFTLQEKEKFYKEYFPTVSPLKIIAIIALFWLMLFELFLVSGLAQHLSQYEWVKNLVDMLTPNVFFNGIKGGGHNALLLKIFMIFSIISHPFKFAATGILLYHFLKNPEVFPIAPSAIFADTYQSRWNQCKSVLWSLVATIILFCSIIINFVIYFSGFNLPGFVYPALSLRLWYITNGVTIVVGGLSITCLYKILIDWISILFSFLFKFNKG